MSNLVLYRKYRPLKFADVINQEHVKVTLQNAIKASRVSHAYLFTGPRGVGKTTLARILARAVNCTNRQGSEPCNECEMCKQLLSNTSLDIMEIDAASNTGVDNIRDLIDHLQFAPTKALYKVIVIDEVHMLSKGAFNALLKTLEEPPKHAIFVLATTEIHKVPTTIISRTQRFDFKKVSLSDLTRLLKFVIEDNKLSIEPEALAELAQAADGSFRDGLSLLDQVINYAQGKITVELTEEVLGLTGSKTTGDFLDLLIAHKTREGLDCVSNLAFAGKDLFQFQRDFLEYLRKILLTKLGSLNQTEGESYQRLKEQADKLTVKKLTQIIETFQKAGSELKWAVIVNLPLELAVVEVTSTQEPVKDGILSEVPASPRVERGEKDLKVDSSTASENDKKKDTATIALQPQNNKEILNLVIEKWTEILEKIKEYNHSLISSLKLAVPMSVVGKELVLVFPYKFHKDTIEARKNRVVVDQVLEDVLGIKLMTKPVLKMDLESANLAEKNNADLVESALKIMGGEVE